MSYWNKYVKVVRKCKNCDAKLALVRLNKLHKFCSMLCKKEYQYKRKKELKHGRETKNITPEVA
jgi:hypothetical protein